MSIQNKQYVRAMVANKRGEFFDLDGYAATGMAGGHLVPLMKNDTITMPAGSELFFLPARRPIVFDIQSETFTTLANNPYTPEEKVFPVAAFNAPGYTICLTSAYEEEPQAKPLPLFSYGAVGWAQGMCRVAGLRVDYERRQDLRLMPMDKVKEGISQLRAAMPSNRLRGHLEHCALTYGCPAAKNLFLGRYEAPLPTSTKCNARCWGCLSFQKYGHFPATQERIAFTPKPDEIAQIAIHHIKKAKRAVVSFGQGCEGDPLFAAEVIEPAIRRIREQTKAGTINMNTNASLPAVLDSLLDAGLDSIRVSMNSVRKPFYEAYFRPKGYAFDDVLKSIDLAGEKGKFVSVNYLNLPGFTDNAHEVSALLAFLQAHPVHMIQWRNLNFDPVRYWQIVKDPQQYPERMGTLAMLEKVRRAFPDLKFGYFNPPKEKFKT